jgi:hypothetical protein
MGSRSASIADAIKQLEEEDTPSNENPTNTELETDGEELEHEEPKIQQAAKKDPKDAASVSAADPKSGTTAGTSAADPKSGTTAGTSAAPPARKAPVSWKPTLRDQFGALPEDVQVEVLRRETEVTQGLREAAEARKFHAQFNEVVAPYMASIQAEGGTPIQAVSALMNTAYILRTAPPQQKAALIADLIMQYGIPVEALDNALVAKVQGRQVLPDPIAQALDARLNPVMDFMKNMQGVIGASTQRAADDTQKEFDAFVNDPKNEFVMDVKDDMADIIEVKSKQGKKITLQEAYDRAILLHPEVSKVVEQRKLKEGAAQKKSAADAARKAGASLRAEAPPAASQAPAPGQERRSALEAAFDQHSE